MSQDLFLQAGAVAAGAAAVLFWSIGLVHLWRRRPNRDGAPSESEALYPPMNEDDWYDSFIPCTVLHIPHAT